MPGFDSQSIAAMSPQELAQLVKATSDGDIKAAMAGPDRGPILEEVFGRFPTMFNADNAAGVDKQINFRVTGGPEESTDTYGVAIKDGTCTVEKDPAGEGDVSLMMGPPDFFKLVTGSGNPVMMAMTGKLKVRGDVGLAQSFAKYFSIPKA